MILFQLKAVIVDSNLQLLVQAEVKFDTDLPEFRTIGGVNAGQTKNELVHIQSIYSSKIFIL